jgi:hypothetical protein
MMPELQLDRTVGVPEIVLGLPSCANKQLIAGSYAVKTIKRSEGARELPR